MIGLKDLEKKETGPVAEEPEMCDLVQSEFDTSFCYLQQFISVAM
jgi:hypothetical protein